MRLAALFAVLILIVAGPARADDEHPRPFDENFAAMDVVDAALAEALATDKRLLLVLGGNWCHDSRGLAHHFEDAELAATLEAHFVTRFIDVGWRDRNQDIMRRFGVAAIYATPTVFVIDPADETLLNRDERNFWGSAYSTPIEEARAWFARWADAQPATGGLVESSLVYQSMMIEIDIFEEEEGDRLAAAYRDVGAWRIADEADRPENYRALDREVEQWRRNLPRDVAQLRQEARAMVIGALNERADGEPFTIETVAALDAENPDLALRFRPHQSERW
ncbi:thioredoxin family protein [uncultured Maricaulis sp.]|uniref:thioredoxin family protein n=1 Tax=uncultured Maricaulis sp. TaxID=174710 RepID=UPI0026027998|nr:thioredoxin family protein [uncultured Maricaulis sp.]